MRAAVLAASCLLFAVRLPTQATECAPYAGTAGRVCSAAVDGTRALHPIAGLLVTGGNPLLGTAATLGGLGHFSVTLCGEAARVVLPETGYDGTVATVPASDDLVALAPLVEAAAGSYDGLASGLPYGDLARAPVFLDAGLDLRPVRLVGELGYQAGNDQELSTAFEDLDTTSGTAFGSLGVRVGL